MNWPDILGSAGRLTKIFNTVEERLKVQDEEVRLLRKENADIRKELAAMAERPARLEESRNTLTEQVKHTLDNTIAEWENRRLKEQIQELQRKQLPSGE